MMISDKKVLREFFLDKRLEFNEERIKEASNCILKQIYSLKIFKEANIIAIFYPIKNEIDLRPLILKKTICLPKVFGDEIKFFLVNSYSDLEKGKFKLFEPKESSEEIKKEDIDIIFVPGIVFSKDTRMRIGYGKGYYDRFLAGYNGAKIGVIFKELTAKFSAEKHDIAMDLILEG